MAEAIRLDELHPVRDGLVTGESHDIDAVQLLGSECQSCKEVSIGTNTICLNCGGDEMRVKPLSSEGELWSYTIIRHKPPGNYLGPDPFEPFALGLVELPDGVRIMAPLEGEPDALRIGTRLELRPWILQDGDGQAYRAFRFAPAE